MTATQTSTALTPIEIFRPGTFTSEEGDEWTITLADCAAMVAGYDPTRSPAPIVIGHPKMDAPAQGWIESLALGDDGIVRAMPGQLDPAFVEGVRAGRFKKVSARFYPPENPHNPVPGIFSLRHVGALGAHPPAVKGLRNLSFAEGSDAHVLRGPDQDMPALQVAEAEGATASDQEQPKDDEHQPKKEAEVADNKDEGGKGGDASFAEAQRALTEGQEQLKRDREQLVADRNSLETAATKAAHEANVSFVESAIAAAKLSNAGKDQFVFLLDQLSARPADVSFGEGEKKKSPADLLKSIITSAAPLVSFGEFAKNEGGKAKMSAASMSAAATKYQAEQKAIGNVISIAQALRHVEREMAL